MTATFSLSNEQCEINYYHIRIKGHLNDRWTEWFDGMKITLEEDGNTLLSGSVVDQAALYGLLRKVRDLGMPLLTLNCDETEGKRDE